MNTKLGKFRIAAPLLLLGVFCTAGTQSALEKSGRMHYQPNPGALARSPFGRTVGMALQGPITKFWDRGVGSVIDDQEDVEGSRPDQKLFNWVNDMRDAKTDVAEESKLYHEHRSHIMARIEKKLALAWDMDPRNYANYAIYQMFLWENFSSDVIESEHSVRDLSLATLEASLADEDSPISLLTAGQATYDLVFAARTSTDQNPSQASQDIKTYSELLPDLIGRYEGLVAEMKADGRWDKFSEVKRLEFGWRKNYLEKLKEDTDLYISRYGTSASVSGRGNL